MRSHRFTCHPHTNHTCLYSPDTRRHHPMAGTQSTKGWPGWVDLAGWSHAEINVPHWELNPYTVTHHSTNRAWHRVISCTPLQLSQAATTGYCNCVVISIVIWEVLTCEVRPVAFGLIAYVHIFSSLLRVLLLVPVQCLERFSSKMTHDVLSEISYSLPKVNMQLALPKTNPRNQFFHMQLSLPPNHNTVKGKKCAQYYYMGYTN